MKLLVVDDDAFSAELIGLTLEASGYEIVLAEGGVEALEKISEDPLIGIVVSDMNMPFIDGIELFKELRDQGHAQPFVLLTGGDPDSLQGLPADIDAVLAKDERIQETLPELIEGLLAP